MGSVNDPHQTLTFVGEILIGPTGELLVAQPQDQQIRVYNESGQIVRIMGHKGAGPGEFETVSSMGFLGDTLYATDVIQKRISYFDQDGNLYRTVMTLSSPMLGTQMPALILPTVPQVLLRDESALVLPGLPVAWHNTGEARAPYLRISQSTGEILDTLLWRQYPPDLFYMMHNGNRMGAWRPFPSEPLFAFAPDGTGIVTASREPAKSGVEQGTYRVTRINPEGDTVFTKAMRYRPQRVAPGIVDRAAQRSRDFMARRHDPPTLAAIRDHLQRENWVPSTMVPVTDLVVGQDGSIWLRREDAERGQPVRWEVLSSTGDHVGAVTLPSQQTVKQASGDVLVATELDELDVPYVIRYRIRRR
jgi:hypothetical protein